jgi:hypothetical protein
MRCFPLDSCNETMGPAQLNQPTFQTARSVLFPQEHRAPTVDSLLFQEQVFYSRFNVEIRSSRNDHLETPESWVDIPELRSSRCGS